MSSASATVTQEQDEKELAVLKADPRNDFSPMWLGNTRFVRDVSPVYSSAGRELEARCRITN